MTTKNHCMCETSNTCPCPCTNSRIGSSMGIWFRYKRKRAFDAQTTTVPVRMNILAMSKTTSFRQNAVCVERAKLEACWFQKPPLMWLRAMRVLCVENLMAMQDWVCRDVQLWQWSLHCNRKQSPTSWQSNTRRWQRCTCEKFRPIRTATFHTTRRCWLITKVGLTF